MKISNTFLLFYLLTVFACTTNNSKEPKPIVDSSLKKVVLDTSTTNSIASLVDTLQYLNLPYWTKEIDRFSDAYIDTFSVAGNKFRFVNPIATHQTGGNSVALQSLINGKWTISKLELEDNIHGGNFFHDQDINGDGFIDIVNTIRFTAVVYFYNPKINSFIDTPALEEVNPDWVLLDKAKNIYCDFQEYKGMCDEIHSKLYTYKEFKRIDLYDLTLYNCSETNNETNIITKLILSKCINSNSEETKVINETKLDKPIDTQGYNDNGKYPNGSDTYFDYKKYWQDKYKGLLGSSQH